MPKNEEVGKKFMTVAKIKGKDCQMETQEDKKSILDLWRESASQIRPTL